MDGTEAKVDPRYRHGYPKGFRLHSSHVLEAFANTLPVHLRGHHSTKKNETGEGEAVLFGRVGRGSMWNRGMRARKELCC